MIAISDLTFARPGQPPALEAVSVAAPAGEVLCVLGPNGAGKSTLLNCILGIETRWSGRIELAGRDARTLPRMASAKLAAYVPQASSAVFSFTVAQCVMMGRTPHIPLGGEPGAADHEAVRVALAEVGIERFAERRYDALSGGERQLVLIARAIAQDAPIILLDEPTTSLDLANQATALRLVRGLAGRGRTILMTTHLPEQAFLLDCRVMLLKRGRVLEVGPARTVCTESRLQDLYDTPVRLVSAVEDGAASPAACILRL